MRSGARLRRATPRGSTRPSGLRAVAGGAPGDADLGRRCRARSATRCTSRDAADGPWEPLDHAGRDVLAVPHPPYVDTTGDAGPASGGTPSPSLSDVHVEGDRCPSRSSATPPRGRRGPVTRRPSTPADDARRAAPAVAADDRQRAPLARALDRHHRRPGDRRGADARRCGGARRARRQPRAGARDPLRRPRRLPRGRRRAGARLHRRRPGLRPHPLARALPGRRDLVHAARPGERPDEDGVRVRRDHLAAEGLGALARPGPRPRPRTSSTATASTRSSSTGPSRCGTRPTSRCSGPARPRSTSSCTTSPRPPCASVDERLRGRRAVLGRRRLGRGAARPRRASRARRSTSSPRTPTAAPPLDFRPIAGAVRPRRARRSGGPSGASRPTHFNEVSDAVFSGAFLLRGMASAMGRIEALSYWVVSDHFEELGRPPALLHGGFGLRTVGELRKPRWWALALLERLGDHAARGRRSTATAPARWSRRSRPASDDGEVGGAGCGTSPSTRPRRPGPPTWPRPVDGRGRRPRRRGVVHAAPRPRRRRPLQHRRGLGPAHATTARTGRPTSSGRRCARPTGSTRSSRTATVTADDDGAVTVDFDLPMPSMSQLTLVAGRVAVGVPPGCALDGRSSRTVVVCGRKLRRDR